MFRSQFERSLVFSESRCDFWFIEIALVILGDLVLKVLMIMLLVSHHRFIVMTVAVTAVVGYTHHDRVVDIPFQIPPLHLRRGGLDRILRGVCMVCVCIIGFELLRREISMVNLLIGLRHPIVRIVNWGPLETSLVVRVVWIA